MTRTFKALLLFTSAAATLAATQPGAARADGFEAGDILIRGRFLAVMPQTSSSSGISLIGGEPQATDTFAPEVDASYFFTSHIAAELIAATTRHETRATGTALGNVDLGKVWLLPPTLTLQYHFFPSAAVDPYVGAGINYTIFYNSSAPGPGNVATRVTYENSAGAALQVGADYHITGNWYANFDVKYIFLSTHVSVDNGLVTANVALNPLLIGLGLGYKF